MKVLPSSTKEISCTVPRQHSNMTSDGPTHHTAALLPRLQRKEVFLLSLTDQAHAHLLKRMPFYSKVLERQEMSDQEQYCCAKTDGNTV